MKLKIAVICGCGFGSCADSETRCEPKFVKFSADAGEANLYKKALYLSYFSVGYNFLEGLVSVIAGSLAGSVALVGFGLDSFVESLSGGVMIWRFTKHGRVSKQEERRAEEKAVRLVSVTFFILAAYVFYESVNKLYFREISDQSLVGVIIALVSIVVMPVLYRLKLRTARLIGAMSMIADSKQTLACVFLSLALLLGLGLNYIFGIWWADPAIGLIIALVLFREGYTAIRDKKLCSC